MEGKHLGEQKCVFNNRGQIYIHTGKKGRNLLYFVKSINWIEVYSIKNDELQI